MKLQLLESSPSYIDTSNHLEYSKELVSKEYTFVSPDYGFNITLFVGAKENALDKLKEIFNQEIELISF